MNQSFLRGPAVKIELKATSQIVAHHPCAIDVKIPSTMPLCA